jgi:hypothetical protein
MLRTILYWSGLILSCLITLNSLVIIVHPLMIDQAHSATPEIQIRLVDIIPVLPLFLTSFATFSTILLGWRLDRRQVKELNLKTKELELKVKELEIKLVSAQISNIQPSPQQYPNF